MLEDTIKKTDPAHSKVTTKSGETHIKVYCIMK